MPGHLSACCGLMSQIARNSIAGWRRTHSARRAPTLPSPTIPARIRAPGFLAESAAFGTGKTAAGLKLAASIVMVVSLLGRHFRLFSHLRAIRAHVRTQSLFLNEILKLFVAECVAVREQVFEEARQNGASFLSQPLYHLDIKLSRRAELEDLETRNGPVPSAAPRPRSGSSARAE